MHSKTTDELLKILNSAETLSELNQFSELPEVTADTLPVHVYLQDYMMKSNITPGELIKNAQIQRNYGYQILNGTKKPGRDKIIALCLALSMELPDAQRALTLAQEGVLYPKCRRDSILIFCINKKCTVQETNELLYGIGETTLE